MAELPLAGVAGIPRAGLSVLAEHWIRTVRDLLSLTAVPRSREALARVVGADVLVECERLARQAAGPSLMEAALGPRPLPPLGLRLSPAPPADRAAALTLARVRPPGVARDRALASLPAYVTLLDRMHPIQSQGSRGTCVAFATTAAREYFLGPDGPKLSEQFLYWLCKETDGYSDESGTWPSVAANGLVEVGICTEEEWPYNPSPDGGSEGQGPPPDGAVAQAWEYRCADFLDMDAGTPALPPVIVEILNGFTVEGRSYEARPVVVGLPVYPSWESAETWRTGKIFRRVGNEPCRGGHAMCVVGYRLDEDVPGGGYFIVRNSWGEDWASECPEGPGHALISFLYVEEAHREGDLSGTALFSRDELQGSLSVGADAVVERAFEEGCARYLGAIPSDARAVEEIEEHTAERRYRPDASLESERILARKVRRFVIHEESIDLPTSIADREVLRAPALKGAVERRLGDVLTRFEDRRTDFDGLLAEARRLVPRRHWLDCFVFDGNEVPGSRAAEGRAFRHLPLSRVPMPPIPGLPAAAERVLGQRYALAATRFEILRPRSSATEQTIDVCRWFGLTDDLRLGLGNGVRVGIVDSGLDCDHPDLRGVPSDQLCDFTGEGFADPNGHGTHCAGILTGRTGVAPAVSLFVARIFDAGGTSSLERIYAALDWLIDQGVAVMSLSLGTGESPNGTSQLTQTCDYVGREHGVVVCAAAGNNGPGQSTITPPADGQLVVSVAAMSDRRRLAEFSSRGSRDRQSPLFGKPLLGGPGVRVVAPRSAASDLPAVDPDGLYAELSGTSMACPAVAGLAALLWSACDEGDPRRRREQVVAALADSAEPPTDGPRDPDFEVGRGIPDLARALALLGPASGRPGVGDEDRALGSQVAPRDATCSWSGIPLPDAGTPGEHYFACANRAHAPANSDRWISGTAWKIIDRRRASGERKWCRSCLAREWERTTDGTGYAIARARGPEAAATFLRLAAGLAQDRRVVAAGDDWASGPIGSCRTITRRCPASGIPFFGADDTLIHTVRLGAQTGWWPFGSTRDFVVAFVEGEPYERFRARLAEGVPPTVSGDWQKAALVVWGAVGSPGDQPQSGSWAGVPWHGVPCVPEGDGWMRPRAGQAESVLARSFELETEASRQQRWFLALDRLFAASFSQGGVEGDRLTLSKWEAVADGLRWDEETIAAVAPRFSPAHLFLEGAELTLVQASQRYGRRSR